MDNKALINKTAEMRSEILANCLQMIESGAASVDDCIRRHPEFTELRELLDAAAAVQNLQMVGMPVHSKRLLRKQVLAHYQSRPKPQRATLAWPLMRGLVAMGLVVIILFTSGVGLTYAAKDTLPGDTLYPLKRAVEQIQLSSTDGGERVDLLVEIANKRLREIDTLLLLDREIPSSVVDDTANAITNAVKATSNTNVQNALTIKAEVVFEHAQEAGVLGAGDATYVFNSLDKGKGNGNGKPASETPKPTSTNTPSSTVTFTSSPTSTDTDEPTNTPTETLLPSETATVTNTSTPKVTATKTRPAFRPTKANGNGTGKATANSGNSNGNANGSANGSGGNSNGNANGSANGSGGNSNGNANGGGNANGNGNGK
jgi:hypothetical protein